jgi:hypothetical protein
MGPEKKTPSVAGPILAMCALGALAFGGFGALAAQRTGVPLEAAGRPTMERGADAVSVLRTGAARAVDLARVKLLAGERTPAVVALDAARRAARVGTGAGLEGFGPLLAQVEQARHAVQNGHAERAPEILGAATRAFAASMPTGRATENKQAYRAVTPAMRGATVINAAGVRIGELESVGPDAVIALGPRQDIFGFIDLGGPRVHVPRERLVAGATSSRGNATVMLSVVGARPADVEAELAGIASQR